MVTPAAGQKTKSGAQAKAKNGSFIVKGGNRTDVKWSRGNERGRGNSVRSDTP